MPSQLEVLTIGHSNHTIEKFLELLRQHHATVPRDVLADSCLLCSEDKPDHCHRRLVAEYLKAHWSGVDILHLGHESARPAPRL